MSTRSIHPFPARMAPSIALDYLSQRVADEPLTVLDPMCGSGTVLASAMQKGHNAVGLDLDPLAILISRVTTTAIDLDELSSASHQVVTRARRLRSREMPWADDETKAFARYWFSESQRLRLARLSRAIEEVAPTIDVAEALQIAFSRLIITKEPKASLARDTSHSRPHRVTAETSFDIYEGFSNSVRALARLLAARTLNGSANLLLDDARVMRCIDDDSIDLTITSPPYLNAIDYLRGHRLSLIWMGHSIPELRRLRSESIGSQRGIGEGHDRGGVEAIVSMIRATATSPDRLPERTIRRYARDMSAFAHQLYRVSRPGASALLVVGNSTVRGNFVRNDAIAQEALVHAGFEYKESVERELPSNRRYLPVTQRSEAAGSLGGRMMTETVLNLRKPV